MVNSSLLPIKLRRSRPEDAQALYAAVLESRSELQPWMPWCHPDYELADAQLWLEGRKPMWAKGREYDLLMINPGPQRLLGVCGLHNLDRSNRLAQAGYWVRTSCCGQGVATSALGLLADFAFAQLKLQRLEMLIATDNTASQRVAHKAGARQEGLLRRRIVVGRQCYDALLFSLLAGEQRPTLGAGF